MGDAVILRKWEKEKGLGEKKELIPIKRSIITNVKWCTSPVCVTYTAIRLAQNSIWYFDTLTHKCGLAFFFFSFFKRRQNSQFMEKKACIFRML